MNGFDNNNFGQPTGQPIVSGTGPSVAPGMPPVQQMVMEPGQPAPNMAAGAPGQTGQAMPNMSAGAPGQTTLGQPAQPIVGYSPAGQPMIQQVVAEPAPKKDMMPLLKTIALVILSLTTVTFIGLFIWMNSQYTESKTNVNAKIEAAVNEAVDSNTTKLELEFAEREKYPYTDFTGPADYGSLAFKYPKTWNLYVAADSTDGKDYQAYFNPKEVPPVSNTNTNALRLSIVNKSFDEVQAEYVRYMERSDVNLTVESVTIGVEGSPITANRYTGTIPESELSGYIVVFKIRDKTAIMQSDAVQFEADFNTLLGTVHFNA